jgi:hypothetical protein
VQIISSYQLQKGTTAERYSGFNSSLPTIAQPLQMLPYDKKDDNWRAWCMDWYEWQGIRQIQQKIRKKAKNYRLANGVIDKNDYIATPEDDENKQLLDILTREDDITNISELNFYPIIPNVVDLLVGEFSKRNNRVFPFAVDEQSQNEKLDKKKELLDNVLISQAQKEISERLIQMGVDPESEEFLQQASPEAINSLPEVQRFMTKTYRTSVEQWSAHQINADRLRFRMDELEVIGFRDSLIVDEEFWHIRMGESDYEPELWNPLYTFYHKSPNKRYISESNFVGHIELLTVSDVIDNYGYLMSKDELESLENILPTTGAQYLLNGQNDGFYYDTSKSVSENQTNGSLGYKQFMAWEGAFGSNNSVNSLFDWVMQDGDLDVLTRNMLRVTTTYFRSQRMVYSVTKVDEVGNISRLIADESYKPIVEPLYDNTFLKEKTDLNLLYGEHLEPIWIPEVWGGVKIGPNINQFGYQSTPAGLKPIYLGMMGKHKPDRLPFQFKGTDSLYGSRIPVEGAKFSERNSKAMSLVDRMKPFQLAFNVVNNQIQDIIIDENGMVILLDHNTLPKHSMGEEWGPNNLAKAYVAMKNFQMLPLDYSMENMETSSRFGNLQAVDMSQTQRLLGRIQLANYFRQEAYLAIGVTQERMGSVSSQQSATGAQISVNNSYAQTEKYFIQHSDWLMPRVYELMINAAQYYISNNPSTRLSYITDKGEQVLFDTEGINLLPRDVNVHCTTTFSARDMKQKLESLALNNNTTGATIYDLGKIIQSNTPSEIIDALQEVDAKVSQQRQQEQQHEQAMQQQILDSESQKDAANKQFEAEQNELDRQARILERQIQAAGYAGGEDINQNNQSDYLDSLKMIQQQKEYQSTMGFNREKEINKLNIEQQKLAAKRDEIQARREIADKQLKIAKENKNKHDKK